MRLCCFRSGNDFGPYFTLTLFQFARRNLLSIRANLTEFPDPSFFFMVSCSPNLGLNIQLGLCGSEATLSLLERVSLMDEFFAS